MQIVLKNFPIDAFSLIFETLIPQLDIAIQVITGHGEFFRLFRALELEKLLPSTNPSGWIIHAIITWKVQLSNFGCERASSRKATTRPTRRLGIIVMSSTSRRKTSKHALHMFQETFFTSLHSLL
ncbi:hypothetical protein I3842_08G109200 [Carya illinoinensis]|uniref:Uncharacterized protein n=1 Tax=Carya illinoinensis TaxID=32201 RepID=A0A922EEE9_CARIL|nr:hypothetical protein I3842_08G109200 [Carya illinoinensis]